jgi:hypothetical protein
VDVDAAAVIDTKWGYLVPIMLATDKPLLITLGTSPNWNIQREGKECSGIIHDYAGGGWV